MMGRLNEESRHYSIIWTEIICPVKEVIKEECDSEFSAQCSLRTKNERAWKETLEKEYRALRKKLKIECYGSDSDDGSLDSRKLAAVFCKAIINKKFFVFDTKAAQKLLKIRKKQLSREQLNLWIAHNLLLNYKFAYYVSLQMVYITLLDCLLSSDKTAQYGERLNEIGHLYAYPHAPETDSYDINIIVGLARSDFRGNEFDMFLFAMQLYQIEMYTVERLKGKTSECNSKVSLETESIE